VNNWEVEQVDFIGAFLNAKLDVDLYMELLEGLYEFSCSSPEALTLLKQYSWDPFED